MKVDNYRKIFNMMTFLNEGDFYIIEIIKRRKDNEDLKKSEKLIKTIYIRSKDEFRDSYKSIRNICDQNNARAYFRPNVRNDERIAMEALKLTTNYIADGNYKAVENAYHKAAGRNHSELYKKWIVDIDNGGFAKYKRVLNAINSLHGKIRLKPYRVIETINTLNGYHIITNPFNTKEFKSIIEDEIDIHKDNGTLLYFNNINDVIDQNDHRGIFTREALEAGIPLDNINVFLEDMDDGERYRIGHEERDDNWITILVVNEDDEEIDRFYYQPQPIERDNNRYQVINAGRQAGLLGQVNELIRNEINNRQANE